MAARREKKPEWLRQLSVLRLRPGDVLVVSPGPPATTEAERAALVKSVERALEWAGLAGYKVIVLNSGMKLGVIRPCTETPAR